MTQATSRATLSIAMCTYNGARHLPEQLQSFAAQTQLPDELVVCDDCSTDNSVDIVRRFAATAPFPVRLLVNDRNIGFVRNFAQAIEAVDGELILLSDQDDVWHPEKLAVFARVYRQRPDAGVILCDAELVDQTRRPLGRTWWASKRFGRAAQRRLGGADGALAMLKNPAWVTAGATMAFPCRFRERLLPVPSGWNHDGWIATVIAAEAPIVLVAQPLNEYRQHGAQVFGGSATASQTADWAQSRGASADHFLATVERYRALRARLHALPGATTRPPDFAERVAQKIEHWQRRADMRHARRLHGLSLLAREALNGRYARYSQGWKSLALDASWCLRVPGRH